MSPRPDAPLVWLDGAVQPAGQARVAALDHGLTVGDGVFETLKLTPAGPFALTRHLRRLERSATAFDLPLPPQARLRAAIEELLAAADHPGAGRLRITLTGGPGPLGSERGGVGPTLIVALGGASRRPERSVAATVPWTRNERSPLAGVKSTSYAENVIALAEARRRGAGEALFANTRGELCEGTGSNVVVEAGGRLVTPPLSSGCLAGVTRELFLEWAAQEGLPVAEAAIPMTWLDAAGHQASPLDGLLLTSSTRDVQRVDVLDGRDLPAGPLGKAAVDLFARRAAEQVDP